MKNKMTYKYITNTRGHVWKLTDEGEIDILAYYPYDPHNGPLCIICGYGFCHHCQDEPDCDCTGAIEGSYTVLQDRKLIGDGK